MNNNIVSKFKNICKSLGENNKPTYVVMAIATVKGICRPMFTMMDKKENPKTKKYTAIREGLTEIIAIPVYWGLGEVTAKIATKSLPKDLQKKGAKNAMFLGVCTAALFVIPALCSAVIKPVMSSFYHDGDNKKANNQRNNLNIISKSEKIPVRQYITPDFRGAIPKPFRAFGIKSANSMKVGGV